MLGTEFSVYERDFLFCMHAPAVKERLLTPIADMIVRNGPHQDPGADIWPRVALRKID